MQPPVEISAGGCWFLKSGFSLECVPWLLVFCRYLYLQSSSWKVVVQDPLLLLVVAFAVCFLPSPPSVSVGDLLFRKRTTKTNNRFPTTALGNDKGKRLLVKIKRSSPSVWRPAGFGDPPLLIKRKTTDTGQKPPSMTLNLSQQIPARSVPANLPV